PSYEVARRHLTVDAVCAREDLGQRLAARPPVHRPDEAEVGLAGELQPVRGLGALQLRPELQAAVDRVADRATRNRGPVLGLPPRLVHDDRYRRGELGRGAPVPHALSQAPGAGRAALAPDPGTARPGR